MLTSLYIKNFVLISELSLDFHDGFHAFIGETGAGKSILMDAISLVCGERASSDVVRRGCSKAIIEAVFDMDDVLREILEEAGISVEDDTVILTREISGDGRSVSRINHRNVTLSLLKEVGSMLVDQHSQFDTVSMKLRGGYLEMLDRYCQHEDLLVQYKRDYKAYLEAVKALENFNEEKMDEYEIELMEYAINEIEDADIGENELDEIDATLKRMSQSEHIKEKGNEALSLLEGDNGALESLYSAVQAISSIRIEECEEIEEGLRNYYYELEELKSKLSQFVENSFLDEEEYRRLQERGFMIRKLFRKYGGSYHSLMEEVESMREKLSHAVDYEAYLLKLENAKDDAMDRALKSASLLHKSRMNHTTELVNAMHHELQDLSLPSAQFIVVTQETDLSPNGIDEVIFEVSMNKGEAFKPLMKVASGGELSRFMLGLKVVLAQREKTPVMIFDEIDSGISGATAYAVGHKMLALSKYTQVFSVTHLAQVAAACDHLYFISKREEEGVTFSSVQELDDTLKIEKLALIGSGNISETSISNAQEMIAKARQV